MKRLFLACLLTLAMIGNAWAVTWTDWTTGLPAPTGTIENTTVTLTGPLTLAPLLGAAGEPNYFASRTGTYTAPPVVENLPPTSDVIKTTLAGDYTLTFSQPVTDPIFAIVSMGGTTPTTSLWNFGEQPVVILKSGPGSFGTGAPLSFTATVTNGVTSYILAGTEGNGLVQFPGTMTTLKFKIVNPENWSGFQLGLPVAIPTPTPTPTPEVPFTLTWTAPNVVKNLDGTILEVTGYNLYVGQGARCADVTPLPSANVTIPVVTTYTDTVPAILGDVCFELTSLAGEAESAHSQRAIANIGKAEPFPPSNLHLTIP